MTIAISATDSQRWQEWLGGRPAGWRLRLECPEGAVQAPVFREFAAALQAAFPQVTITTDIIAGQGPPALRLGDTWRWHGLPAGPELPLFLEAAAAAEDGPPPLPAGVAPRVAAVSLPTELEIFISEHCPFCPGVVRQLIPLTLALPRGRVQLYDCGLFPEAAAAADVKAVPTVILNGLYRLTGALKLSEVVDLLEQADPAELATATLERLLTEGQASLVAEMMVRQGKIFPGFMPLLSHEEWNVRLGAMVAVETVAAAAPELARAVLAPLWEGFAAQDTAVQGDILYLVGELGDRSWLARLETYEAPASDPDLAELLQETREKLAAS